MLLRVISGDVPLVLWTGVYDLLPIPRTGITQLFQQPYEVHRTQYPLGNRRDPSGLPYRIWGAPSTRWVSKNPTSWWISPDFVRNRWGKRSPRIAVFGSQPPHIGRNSPNKRVFGHEVRKDIVGRMIGVQRRRFRKLDRGLYQCLLSLSNLRSHRTV